MGGTDAERQRRHRAHKRGDHSLCDPDRCRPEAVTAPVTPVTAAPASSDTGPSTPRLRARGRWLWNELVEKGNPGPAERVLIEESCRLADRLDRLDAISNGKDRAWLLISEEIGDVTDGQITVIVDKVLSEARQQQLALKQLLGELRQAAAGAAPASGQGQGGSFRDQLAARRAQRLADAAGS
ncbi:MAG: hypothetical protein JWO57_3959 [Pseudonocardiales bacterium]|nr:hypothetical protein [Pseudonocardiales bacterium]